MDFFEAKILWHNVAPNPSLFQLCLSTGCRTDHRRYQWFGIWYREVCSHAFQVPYLEKQHLYLLNSAWYNNVHYGYTRHGMVLYRTVRENPHSKESFCENAEHANFDVPNCFGYSHDKKFGERHVGIQTSRFVRFKVRTTWERHVNVRSIMEPRSHYRTWIAIWCWHLREKEKHWRVCPLYWHLCVNIQVVLLFR